MPPKLISDDGKNVVIRPLVYASEAELAAFASAKAFPIIPCDLCGSQENLQRKQIKHLIDELNAKNPWCAATCSQRSPMCGRRTLLDAKLSRALGLTTLGTERPPNFGNRSLRLRRSAAERSRALERRERGRSKAGSNEAWVLGGETCCARRTGPPGCSVQRHTTTRSSSSSRIVAKWCPVRSPSTICSW